MKTSELTGAALVWAVAECEGYTKDYTDEERDFILLGGGLKSEVDWEFGGPIIEREKIALAKDGHQWMAMMETPYFGPTPLIAAMRCYVASKLGDEVDIPNGLR